MFLSCVCEEKIVQSFMRQCQHRLSAIAASLYLYLILYVFNYLVVNVVRRDIWTVGTNNIGGNWHWWYIICNTYHRVFPHARMSRIPMFQATK